MYYNEIDPVTFQKNDRVAPRQVKYSTALQLGAYEGMEYYRTHPIASVGLLALLTLPVFLKTHASLMNPVSGLNQSLTFLGLQVDQHLPNLASWGLAAERLLADVKSVQNPSNVPIIRGCQEALALTAQGLAFGSLVSLVKDNFSEQYLKNRTDGQAHVSRIYPLRTVFIGDHRTIDGIQRARVQAGLPINPSVFIDPTPITQDSYKPSGYMPYLCPYWFRSDLAKIDDRHRYQGGRIRERPSDTMGLRRTGTVFASTRLPGNPLYADRSQHVFPLHEVGIMMREMDTVFPGMWRAKSFILDTPIGERMYTGYKDGVTGLSDVADELGAQLRTTDTEGVFEGEVYRILRDRQALERARNEDAMRRKPNTGFSIAIAPTPGADVGEVRRMADALCMRNAPDIQIEVTVLSEGIQEGDSSHDMVVVTGPDSNDVYGMTNEAVALGRAGKEDLFPIVYGAYDAHSLAKVNISCFDVAHAIVASAYQQPNQ